MSSVGLGEVGEGGVGGVPSSSENSIAFHSAAYATFIDSNIPSTGSAVGITSYNQVGGSVSAIWEKIRGRKVEEKSSGKSSQQEVNPRGGFSVRVGR